ncbi:putative leucine-rich repeat domain, L domain-containing protein [Medicago truncatula]|uniref:Putative leucine-rich repeat domain, L domain-containing protein n=1 Tax=Medicago truncatula TaxID=3880 RepID=A0A396GYP5_MEDTR|nr:putative leucine-rich repeat domain, L domain-containing protein [Medicago truncatula]
MGDYYWDQVIKEENGRWKCKLCNGSFSGVASRIKAHLDHIKGGGIEPCPYGGVHSHTASTSSNLFEDHQGVSERLSKDTISQTTKASSVKQKLNYKHQTKTGIKPPKLIIKIKGCNTLKKIPPLGELQALSRLVITFCAIEEVPQGLENLINLKWLDLSRNNNLTMKSGFVLSNLSKMQYLDLRCPGVVITVEDVQGMNKLEYFGGALLVDYYSQKVLDISFMLKKYHLILGKMYDEEGNWWDSYNLKSIVPCDPKTKTIHFGYCEQLSHFSHILPKDLIDLYICQNVHWGCLCDTLSYNDSSSLKKLNISTCRQLKYVFCLYHSCSFCTKIHNLEVLELQSLESLTVLCKDVVDVRQYLSPSGIFSCLKEFSVYNCNLLENLFTPRLVQQLQNLETIIIRYCGSMKEILVASNTDDDDSLSIAFPKLTSLELGDLPQLKIVCKGSTSMSLPKLTNLELGDLPQLKIFCKGSISCESLPTLNIYGCQNLDMYSTIIIQDVEIPYYRFCC